MKFPQNICGWILCDCIIFEKKNLIEKEESPKTQGQRWKLYIRKIE